MNSLSLYQITGMIPVIMEQEEITPELKEQLEKELTELLQQKSQNIIGYTKNIELTIEAMKTEEKRISEQRRALENKLDNFKQYVKECMEQNGIKKIDTLGKRKSLYNGMQPRYSFLRKVGVGKNINVNMICKCFSNVIDISKEKLKTIEKSMSETKAVKKIKRIELPKHSRNISIKSNRNYTERSCSTYYKTQNESSNVNIKTVK